MATASVTAVQDELQAAVIRSATFQSKASPATPSTRVAIGLTDESDGGFPAKLPFVQISQVTSDNTREATTLQFGTAIATLRFWEQIDARISTDHKSIIDFADFVIQEMNVDPEFAPGFTGYTITDPVRSGVFHDEANLDFSFVYIDVEVEQDILGGC